MHSLELENLPVNYPAMASASQTISADQSHWTVTWCISPTLRGEITE
jgi:hypothetical protein